MGTAAARGLRLCGPLLASAGRRARRVRAPAAPTLVARPRLRASPFVIVGLGVDLVDIARVRRLIESRGDRAMARLFTDGERAYAHDRVDPVRHFAARIAAKEAAFKALAGNDLARGIGWRELEVYTRADGRPDLRLHGRAERRAAELGVTRVLVTISHTDTTAVAVVALEGG
jgi:holo-[acyl-carrier protein] synthase